MPIEDQGKVNKLEDLKTRLFSKSYKTKIEYKDSFPKNTKLTVPEDWGDHHVLNKVEKISMQTTIFKNLFIFSIFILFISTAYVSYMFLAGGNTVSNENIDISILGNSFTAGGEELPIQIEIINRNNTALELVDLVLEYPTGSMLGEEEEKERIRESLGTIPAGGIRNESMKIVLFGEQGATRSLRVSLEYRLEGSNSIFEKEKLHEVYINATPINLTLTAPAETNPNQEIKLLVNTQLNATRSSSAVLVRMDYPVGFEFISAKPAPSFSNNLWNLGNLSPGATQTIEVTGRLIDVFDGEQKTFHVFAGSEARNDKTDIGVVFNSLGHTLNIKRSFLEAKLSMGGVAGREFVSTSRGSVRAEIKWSNNLNTSVRDMEIRVKLSGNAFDRRSVSASSGGFYNSLEETIIWDRNMISDFREVGPGESGTLIFSMAPLPVISSEGVTKNPFIDMEVTIRGNRTIDNVTVENLEAVDKRTVHIITDMSFTVKALHFIGPFKNTGPIPPKAEQKTTYTITWSLSNTSNDISKAVLRATLPPLVEYVGTVLPVGERLTFNPSTREIVWDIGRIPSGLGISGGAREVSFQVSVLPSLSQVGEALDLLRPSVLTGRDDFANVDVRATRNSINTVLGSNDPYFPNRGGNVVE